MSMTLNEYQGLTSRTEPKDLSDKEKLSNYALGITGEAGEIAENTKKYLYHGHELNREKQAKELGDELWYIARYAKVLGYTLEEIAQMNIEKLQKRYPKGFEKERSILRKDQ